MPYRVLLYYLYTPIEDAASFVEQHRSLCQRLNLKGRILIGHEGINGTLAGTPEATEAYKMALRADDRFAQIEFKEHDSDINPFPKLKVKHRPEIVTLDDETATPDLAGAHLSPQEWHQAALRDDTVVLDARNNFEWEIGRFKDAILPDIDTFREFPQWVREHKQELAGKTVLMYCTGGIRCERASAVLKNEGLNEVYQLHGGIINYGFDIPDGLWEGSCFVFDDRMKVQVNDDAHHQIISKCRFCDTASDDVYNCCNAECNKLIILCDLCRERSNNACSQDCASKHRAGVVKHWDVETRQAM